MKKILLILLTGMLCFHLFACTDNKSQKEVPERKPVASAYDTMIQDDNGVDKCFWEDGQVAFNDHGVTGRQRQKSASLAMQTEYDMWLRFLNRDLDLKNGYYDPIEFEYDEDKIEIKSNQDKENHFIIKVLQPCDKEKIVIKLTVKHELDNMFDENGDPYLVPYIDNVVITISTVE